MTLREFALSALPSPLRQALSQMRLNIEAQAFARITRKDSFDRVYGDGLWFGGGAEGGSGEGSYGEYADHFVGFIHRFLAEHGVKSILDIGAGDFNIGRRIVAEVDRYVAADVSSVIIEQNREKYRDIHNVDFIQLDACVDRFPDADLIIIRQVLQHLSNDEIELILNNIKSANAKYALIVEFIPSAAVYDGPNIDLKSHGPLIRPRSAVEIDKPPFSRDAKIVDQCAYKGDGRLIYYLMTVG